MYTRFQVVLDQNLLNLSNPIYKVSEKLELDEVSLK